MRCLLKKEVIIFQKQMQTFPSKNSSLANSIVGVGPINTYLPYWLWLIFFIGMGIALWKHNKFGSTLTIWVFLLFVAANPAWIGLPGTNSLSNFAIFISSYIPASILASYLITEISQKSLSKQAFKPVLSILILIASIIGVIDRIRDIQPTQYAMLTRPDLIAGEWINENTNPSSKFLINSFTAFYTSRVGSDGGWWLPITANREVFVRPLNADFEQPLPHTQRELISQIVDLIQTRGDVDNPQLFGLLDQENIDHIYIGQQQGKVNFKGTTLNPQLFITSTNYKLIYHQDAVWVFEIDNSYK